MITIKELEKKELAIFRKIIIKSETYNSLYIDLNGSPFNWYGDPTLDWNILLDDNIPCGILLSRLVNNNYHLHCINIDSKYQKHGFGKELMKYHWRKGIERNAKLDSYSLHVESINHNAISFYKKLGYVPYDEADPIREGSGIEDWVNNCKNKNDWPLRSGHLLYYNSLS
jgi:ribosomal protein S18 acetylase RimI-like enzyme